MARVLSKPTRDWSRELFDFESSKPPCICHRKGSPCQIHGSNEEDCKDILSSQIQRGGFGNNLATVRWDADQHEPSCSREPSPNRLARTSRAPGWAELLAVVVALVSIWMSRAHITFPPGPANSAITNHGRISPPNLLSGAATHTRHLRDQGPALHFHEPAHWISTIDALTIALDSAAFSETQLVTTINQDILSLAIPITSTENTAQALKALDGVLTRTDSALSSVLGSIEQAANIYHEALGQVEEAECSARDELTQSTRAARDPRGILFRAVCVAGMMCKEEDADELDRQRAETLGQAITLADSLHAWKASLISHQAEWQRLQTDLGVVRGTLISLQEGSVDGNNDYKACLVGLQASVHTLQTRISFMFA